MSRFIKYDPVIDAVEKFLDKREGDGIPLRYLTQKDIAQIYWGGADVQVLDSMVDAISIRRVRNGLKARGRDVVAVTEYYFSSCGDGDGVTVAEALKAIRNGNAPHVGLHFVQSEGDPYKAAAFQADGRPVIGQVDKINRDYKQATDAGKLSKEQRREIERNTFRPIRESAQIQGPAT